MTPHLDDFLTPDQSAKWLGVEPVTLARMGEASTEVRLKHNLKRIIGEANAPVL